MLTCWITWLDMKLSHNQSLVLIFILILAFFIIYLISQLVDIPTKQPKVIFPGNQDEKIKIDCDTEFVYSVEDVQCDRICKGPALYKSHNGVCTNVLVFDQTQVLDTCDPKLGVMAYLFGDPQLGTATLHCLSIDLGIASDDIKQPNRICGDKSIPINYLDRFPQLSDCDCSKDTFLGTVAATNTVRRHGFCLPTTLKPVFEVNQLVYNDHDV